MYGFTAGLQIGKNGRPLEACKMLRDLNNIMNLWRSYLLYHSRFELSSSQLLQPLSSRNSLTTASYQFCRIQTLRFQYLLARNGPLFLSFKIISENDLKKEQTINCVVVRGSEPVQGDARERGLRHKKQRTGYPRSLISFTSLSRVDYVEISPSKLNAGSDRLNIGLSTHQSHHPHPGLTLKNPMSTELTLSTSPAYFAYITSVTPSTQSST